MGVEGWECVDPCTAPFCGEVEGGGGVLLTHSALDHIKMWSDAIILD